MWPLSKKYLVVLSKSVSDPEKQMPINSVFIKVTQTWDVSRSFSWTTNTIITLILVKTMSNNDLLLRCHTHSSHSSIRDCKRVIGQLFAN